LSGISVVLLETSRKKKGATDWEISKFLLIRAGLILILDMTICQIFWAGKGPYTHVLLSIGLSLMLLSLLRLLPVAVTTVVSLLMLVGYQIALPSIAAQLSQTTHFMQALLFSYSTVTFPAIEFSIFGWAGLMFLGYSLGKGLSIPAMGLRKTLYWAIIALLASWLVLRMIGGFGDLTPYTGDQPWYYFLIMSKTPPSLTYLTFNLGLAGIIFALFSLRTDLLKQLPMKWLVLIGQVSLFFFVMHIVVFGLISRAVLALDLPLPGMALVFLVWVFGLVVMLPITSAYRTLRKRYSILRYL
jgi:hypothetical protein